MKKKETTGTKKKRGCNINKNSTRKSDEVKSIHLGLKNSEVFRIQLLQFVDVIKTIIFSFHLLRFCFFTFLIKKF